MKWSLESLEHNPIQDSKIYFELDLDGLFKQKDFIENFSDSNRRIRRLYKIKVEFYKSSLKKMQILNKLNETSVVEVRDLFASNVSNSLANL